MFENILGQNITEVLANDVSAKTLPNSLLFYGPKFSGKFSCALELSRVMACEKNGSWGCDCPSCRIHEKLLSPNLVVIGSRTCIPEILAAKDTFAQEVGKTENEDEFFTTRLLYVRSVRKLLMRFNPVIWDGSDKISKINPIISSISENLEEFFNGKIDFLRKNGEKITEKIFLDAQKLENSFLPESIPIMQVRNVRNWATLTSSVNKKTVIFENADKMNDNSRNALLKLLEEPNESTNFILLCEKRERIIPTILSRVRSFQFAERPFSIQSEVIKRVFRYDRKVEFDLSTFFENFLSLPKDEIEKVAIEIVDATFCDTAFPDTDEIFRRLNKFEPKIIFRMLMADMLKFAISINVTALSDKKQSLFFQLPEILNDASEQVSIYNRAPLSVIELLREQLLLQE